MMKPGYKTTEFWLSVCAALLGFLMASGVFSTGSSWDKAIGLAAAALASMGYSASRATVKEAHAGYEDAGSEATPPK